MRGWLRPYIGLLALLLWAPLLCGQVMAAELRVAAQEGTEPKYIAADNGHIVGLCVDLFRTIEKLDPTLHFTGDQRWMPLMRTYSELSAGRQDLLCAVQRTAQRDRDHIFIDPPVFHIDYMLIVRADDQVAVHDWDDVRRLGARGVVLLNRGYATVNVLEKLGGIPIDATATSPVMNLNKLVAGRGRFFLHRTPGLRGFIQRAGMEDKVRILPQAMFSTTMHVALGRHVDTAVVERVRRAMQQLQQNGELDRLLQKWD